MSSNKNTEYDVAFSFAGEDREYVEKVALILKDKGVKVFYDKFDEANLWGKNLYDSFSDIYRYKAFFTVIFISKHYKEKIWSSLERQAAQSRAIEENREYILPARFDSTEIQGILPTISYISLKDISIEEFCDIIIQKLVLFGLTVPGQETRRLSFEQNNKANTNPSVFVASFKSAKGDPISDAEVYLIANNNTFLFGITGIDGVVSFEVKTLRQYCLFFAHKDYPAYSVDNIEVHSDIFITVPSQRGYGSLICNSTGYIPGFKGRLNPILDSLNRTYLYADNIAINGGEIQPVTFQLDVPFMLEDCDGVIIQVNIKAIRGCVSLIEYTKP